MSRYYTGRQACSYNTRLHAFTERTLSEALAMVDVTLSNVQRHSASTGSCMAGHCVPPQRSLERTRDGMPLAAKGARQWGSEKSWLSQTDVSLLSSASPVSHLRGRERKR